MRKIQNYDFFGHRKLFFTISLACLVIGIVANFILGTHLDLRFKGGIMMTYSYAGEVGMDEVDKIVSDQMATRVEVVESTTSTGEKNLIITMPGESGMSTEQSDKLTTALHDAFPNNELTMLRLNSVDASMGRDFLLKGIYAIALASIFMMLYVALRFRKIGGIAAGTTAVIALIHDVLLVYFTFIICRFDIDSNFIAVVLTILGYSLNDTIVIYDRIRENKSLMGGKLTKPELLNLSMGQTFTRSLNVSIATFLAVMTVAVVAGLMGLTSITTFAIPMSVGVIFGAYSSIFVAGPLWVTWELYRDRKREAKKATA